MFKYKISRRKAKKMLKANLRKNKVRKKIKILKTNGQTFIIEPTGEGQGKCGRELYHNIACIRYWDFVAIAADHPKLAEVLAEDRKQWRR